MEKLIRRDLHPLDCGLVGRYPTPDPFRRFPVLPVVLYSGEEGWTAATDISELIESVPGGLDRYRPQMRYLLVEERGFSDAELAPMRNLVAALFRLENSRGPEDLVQVIELLIEWLQAPEQADLARALVVWLRRSLLASRMPDIDIPEIENLQEARTMLAERVKDWKKQWQEEARREGAKEGWKAGEEEGRKAGEKKGRRKGESTLLIKQLTHKFGAIDARTQQPPPPGNAISGRLLPRLADRQRVAGRRE